MGIFEKLDLYSFHNNYSGKIIISYKGTWDEHILFSIGSYIRALTSEKEELGKRVFRVFMELAQNLSDHSAEFKVLTDGKKAGIGSMILGDDNGYYYLFAGNMVENEEVQKVIDKCETINSLDRNGLREFKRKQRNLPFGKMGGGNIGLIQVALTSDNPLQLKLTPIDENRSFLSILTKIKHK